MENFPPKLQAFLSLPQPDYRNPKYKEDADNSRFPNDTTTFDVTVKLPDERRSKPRTVVIFETLSQAELYQKSLNQTSHPSVLRPLYADYRVRNEGDSLESANITSVALVFDRYPDTVDAWAGKNQAGVGTLDGMWVIRGSRAVCVTDKFRTFYANLVEPLKALHDSKSYHGKLHKGLLITDDLQVKLVNFKRVRVNDEEDMKKGKREDLRALGRIMSKVISKSIPSGVHLPSYVRFYFELFLYLSDSYGTLSEYDLSVLAEVIYMPPLIYNWRQRMRAVRMTWQCRQITSDNVWIKILPLLKYPGSQSALFVADWRIEISKLRNTTLRKELKSEILHFNNCKNMPIYIQGYGILDFHRNLLVHYPDVFGSESDIYEAEDVLFSLWPDAVSMFWYALLYINIGITLFSEHNIRLVKLDLLDLMKKYSLLRE